MSSGNEIAIVGMSGRFPGAGSVDALWKIIANGEEPILVEGQDPDSPDYSPATSHMVKSKSTLPDIDKFDAGFFGINPREAEMLDPQHRLFLECVWEALEEAGVRTGDRPRPIGVFSGAGMTSYAYGQVDHGDEILEAFPVIIANDKDFVSTRVSFKLNLTGPSVTVQCACSTSLVALHMACQSLLAGECDAAVAGGVSAPAPQREDYLYLPGAMLSPDGRCRSFDANAHGTVFTDGVAVVALMRLEDALAGGYPIRAVITGSAINNDGSGKPGYTAPSVEGQIEVVRQAHAMAGINPRDIGYVEAHGTGTVLGDAVEIGALTAVFREATDDIGFCGLGSVKANIGHTLSAAGVAGVIKAALCLENKALPGIPNFETPNPDIDPAASPFFLQRDFRPWLHDEDKPRNASVSSFGVGGTNAHVVMREAPRAVSAASTRPWQVLPLSARTAAALDEQQDRMCAFLADNEDAAFADIAHTAQTGRRAFEHRRVVIARNSRDAIAALQGKDSERVFSLAAPAKAPKIAFMFTGQGSQYPAMGADVYAQEETFRQAVETCLAALAPEQADEIRMLVFTADPPADASERLTRTETAQIALFVMHYALAELLKSWKVEPALMIGHSIGEYAAACQSGVLSLEDALTLVAARGRLMGEMQPGTMLSIAFGADALPPLGEDIDVAGINAPNLTVVAGPKDAIAALEQRLVGEGIGCRALHTSHAFHSRMMEPMLERFAAIAAQVAFHAPAIPYVSSLTGRIATAGEAADPAFWARQIRNPVRFADGLKALTEEGVTVLVEVGPGRSLSALARQCGMAAGSVISTLPDARQAREQAMAIARAAGRLWLAGLEIDWKAVQANEARQRVRLPTYPFQRQSYWIEPPSQPGGAKRQPQRAEKRADAGQWFYAPVWRQIAPAPEPVIDAARESGNVLIVTKAAGMAGTLADRLAERLSGCGDRVTIARIETGAMPDAGDSDRHAFDPANAAACEALAAALAGSGRQPDRILHLASLAVGAAATDAEKFLESLESGALGLTALLRAITDADDSRALALHIVSSGLFDVTGHDSLVPAQAALLSLARVAPQEISALTARLIDIDRLAESHDLDALAARIDNRFAAAGADETVMALRRRTAWALGFDAIDTGAGATPLLKERGVYMITGGLGKVGLVFARYLARTWKARLVLVGRSALPPRENFDALLADPATKAGLRARIEAVRELEALGAEVITPAANVADEASMRAVLAETDAAFGGLDGVIHGAGVTHLARAVRDTGRAAFSDNYDSKVFGLMVLDRVLSGRRLDFGMVVSSLSAVLGGIAHLAYAAANATADALVASFNQRGATPWTTVNWDAWKFEDGEIDATQAILNALDFSMDAAEGTRAIELLFAMPEVAHAIVATSSLELRVKDWIEGKAVAGGQMSERAGNQYQRPDIATPFVEPEGTVEIGLAEIWRDLLGLDRVGRDDDFLEIGGHSLLAVEMMTRIRKAFGVEFPIDRAMEANTLQRAAAVISELLAADGKTPGDGKGEREAA